MSTVASALYGSLLLLPLVGAAAAPAVAQDASPGGDRAPTDTVFVAAPAGDSAIDRPNVQAAFDAVQSGGTVQFAQGMYMLGAGARLTIPDVTVLGHPDGTVLRGCDPEAFDVAFDEVDRLVYGCTGFYVQAERQTIRGLTFEYTWHGIVVGPYPTSREELRELEEAGVLGPPVYAAGGQRIEGNTFRAAPNGLRVLGTGDDLSVVRDNDFIDVFHAIGIYGAPLHFLDNRIAVEDPTRVPFSRHPGSAILVSPGNTDCAGHVVAGNSIQGHPDAIYVSSYRGGTCRGAEIRDNTIRVSRVKVPAAWGGYEPTADDSTMVGAPITLMKSDVLIPGAPDTAKAILERIVVKDNRIIGAEGLGILVQGASHSRIEGNTITGVERRSPFPGLTWDGADALWEDANGSGIWLSPGSDANEITGNMFEDIAGAAVVVEGDGNRVALDAADAVRDLGAGNRIRRPDRDTARTYDAVAFFDTELTSPASSGVFSHDGRRILLTSDRSGTFRAYALPVDGGEAEPLPTAEAEIEAVSWFPQDDRFLFASDDAGDEGFHLYVRELNGSSIDLTPGEGVEAGFIGWNADRSAFFVRTNERDSRVSDVYRYAADGYGRELVYRNDGDFQIRGVDPDGRRVALQRINSNTDADVFLHDRDTGTTRMISPDVDGVNHDFIAFSPARDVAFYSTDGEGDFTQIWRYDLVTGERAPYQVADWDVRRVRFSPKGSFRITQIGEHGFPVVTVTDLRSGERVEFPTFASGEVMGVLFSPDESMVLLAVMSPRTPVDFFTLDLSVTDAEPRRLTRSLSPALDPEDLVEPRVVRFRSYDGLEIPGFLYRPRQASAKNPVPAMIYIHGGPGGMSTRSWDERLQHLVNHGYAIFAVNHRGSQGYGRAFLHLDDRRHGEADLGDIVAARDWLAGLDWVDGDRIGSMGDSFGGYLTIAALTFHPERFAVGIAAHPAVNWISTLTIAEQRLGPGVVEQYAEIGHPERDAERLRRISPYFHADRIVKPLLIVQGKNDPRFDLDEMGEFVERVRGNGVPVEYLLFEDEGHVLRRFDNRIAAQRAWLSFLNRHLHGPEFTTGYGAGR